jgi:hypothetical protein
VPSTGIKVTLTAPVSGSGVLTVSELVCSSPMKNSLGLRRTTARQLAPPTTAAEKLDRFAPRGAVSGEFCYAEANCVAFTIPEA